MMDCLRGRWAVPDGTLRLKRSDRLKSSKVRIAYYKLLVTQESFGLRLPRQSSASRDTGQYELLLEHILATPQQG